MNLDMDRINEIFGKSMIYNIQDNKEDFLQNIKYMQSLRYKKVEDLVELYPETFLLDTAIFQEKVDLLLEKLGVESFEKIEENVELWGAINES